jgi:hypothetical protein
MQRKASNHRCSVRLIPPVILERRLRPCEFPRCNPGIRRGVRPTIPFADYEDPVVEAAIEQRRQFFEAKKDHLYQIEIFYAVVLEGSRSKTGVGAALAQLLRDPSGGIAELKAQFSNNAMKVLLRSPIEQDLGRLDQRVKTFMRQLSDLMRIEVLDQQGQLRFFRRLLNYDEWRIAGKPQHTQFSTTKWSIPTSKQSETTCGSGTTQGVLPYLLWRNEL